MAGAASMEMEMLSVSPPAKSSPTNLIIMSLTLQLPSIIVTICSQRNPVKRPGFEKLVGNTSSISVVYQFDLVLF